MQKNGYEGKSSEFVLAELLSCMMEKPKAAKAAKNLVSRLGTFSGVLEAPPEEIAEIKEMDMSSAEFLKKIKACVEYYLEDKVSGMKRIFDTDSAVAILRPKFIDKKREIVALLLLDGRGRILYNGVVNEGSVSEVPIYVRRLVELCLRYDAYTAIIAHNHPSGNPLPSRNDINATRDLEFALNGIDVELTDHLIFAGMDYTSMKSSEWLDQIKEEVQQYKQALREETMEQEEALLVQRKRAKKERQSNGF